eukprot:TRINITY_DN32372_c0_g1_i1.p1 TRINITY_DN32372_c0_g1~~TRINITY_DN32372_c0_g1_i1.p1  ORF type:complete len:139 (+),score=11.38 TRINITY_DN32372_c0_g1_i1:85-501(+)
MKGAWSVEHTVSVYPCFTILFHGRLVVVAVEVIFVVVNVVVGVVAVVVVVVVVVVDGVVGAGVVGGSGGGGSRTAAHLLRAKFKTLVVFLRSPTACYCRGVCLQELQATAAATDSSSSTAETVKATAVATTMAAQERQ